MPTDFSPSLQYQHLPEFPVLPIGLPDHTIKWANPLKYLRDIKIFFSSVQSLNRVWLFVTSWTAARQASLSNINFQSLLKLMSIKSVMPSNHLILCRPLLLLPSIFPSIGVFSNESALCIRWPKYWSFSFSISPSNEHPGLISFRMDWLDLLKNPLVFFFTYHTHTQSHIPYWFYFSGEPWLI